jgi:predicted dehydrogenase
MSSSEGKKCYSIGFIGGSIASAVGHTHQIASQMDGRWKLEAGCFSQTELLNNQTAKEWGVCKDRTYKNYHELLLNEKGKLDVIVVLTPTPTHTQIVIDVINAGYGVICEKALSVSSHEAHLIESAVNQQKQFLAVTLNYTGYPMLRELRRMIDDGKLGEIQQIQIEMPQEGFSRLDGQGNKPCPQSWRLKDGTIPTISLDLGVHLQHIVHYLTQAQPLTVVADQSSFGWFDGVVDDVSCLIKYTDNIRCQMWYSKTAMGHRNGLKVRIYGNKASAEWSQMEPEDLHVSHVDGRREIIDRASSVDVASELRFNRFKAGHPAGFVEAFANLYCDIADSYSDFLKTGEYASDEVFGITHSLEGLKLFEAIAESVLEHKWVTL